MSNDPIADSEVHDARRLTNDDPRDDTTLESVLEAFNADDAIMDPGVPAEQRDEPASPAVDTEVQPPL